MTAPAARPPRIVIAAGGTAGHVVPAIAVADALPSGLYTGSGIEEYVRTVLSDPDRTDDFRLLQNELYLAALQRAVAAGDLAACNGLMRDATRALVQWQSRADAQDLPPYDDALLRRELALRGVERGLVDGVLAERGEGDDPEPDASAAHRLLERRGAALLRVTDVRARRQKAYAMLARNGFDPGVCASVSRSWVGADEARDE